MIMRSKLQTVTERHEHDEKTPLFVPTKSLHIQYLWPEKSHNVVPFQSLTVRLPSS